MSIDLLETLQKNLGYPALQKIDPNTEAVVVDDKMPEEHKFSQAAIPAVLTAFYKYVQADEGAASFLRGDSSSNWVSKIFLGNQMEVVQKITAYSKEPGEDSIAKLNAMANETVKVVKENLPAGAEVKDVKLFFSSQRTKILLYLPAALNMGELLKDDTLDDNTNKMEGPISSLMHSIGAAFSTPVTTEEIKNP